MIPSPFQLITTEIKKSLPAQNLISIILFGSAVTSDKSAHDYDILIVTRKLPPHNWILAGEIKYRLLGKINKPLDIVFMEERDLAYASPFIYEVGQKSKVLYGKNMGSAFRRMSKNIQVFAEGGRHIGWQVA